VTRRLAAPPPSSRQATEFEVDEEPLTMPTGDALLETIQMLLLLFLVIAAVGGPFGRDAALDARLRRLERSVERIARQVGVEPEAPSNRQRPSEAVLDAIRARRRIEAIRLYREETGAGLREAKDAVDEFERSLPTRS
jgi:hypothetical protein